MCDKMLENNNNKVAIVTGTSSGIGYATSLALSRAGVSVAAGARRIDRLQELEEQLSKMVMTEEEEWKKKKKYLYEKNRCYKQIRL